MPEHYSAWRLDGPVHHIYDRMPEVKSPSSTATYLGSWNKLQYRSLSIV